MVLTILYGQTRIAFSMCRDGLLPEKLATKRTQTPVLIILRRTKPDMKRGFRVPFVPLFPIIGTVLCIYLMSKLEAVTWLRFGAG